MVIGSGKEAPLRINHPSVREKHCLITTNREGIRIKSLAGKTVLNDLPVEDAWLKEGDTILLGRVEIKVEQRGKSYHYIKGREEKGEKKGSKGTSSLKPVKNISRAVKLYQNAKGPSFHDILEKRTREIPWLGVSLVAHLICLAVLWHVPILPHGKRKVLSISDLEAGFEIFQANKDATGEGEGPGAETDEPIPEESIAPPMVLEGMEGANKEESFAIGIGSKTGIRNNPFGASGGQMHKRHLGSWLTKGTTRRFRKRLEYLRLYPEDIIFLLDTTGSMAEGLALARESLLEAVTALKLMVPGTRLGLVMFKDPFEKPGQTGNISVIHLSPEPWALLNMLETVSPKGGGNPSESLFMPLLSCLKEFDFTVERGKTVILIGDAGFHRKEEKDLRNLVSSLMKKGIRLHTIYTGLPPETSESAENAYKEYKALAAMGGGEFTMLRTSLQAAAKILNILVGGNFEHDAAQVVSTLDSSALPSSKLIRSMLRKGNYRWFVEQLSKERIYPGLVMEGIAGAGKGLLLELLSMVSRPSGDKIPFQSRHAALYILMKTLNPMGIPLTEIKEAMLGRESLDLLKSEISRLK